MAKTYRVAVIGRTGKGNYGHGLDVVWRSIERTAIHGPISAPESEASRSE
jgi:hypothetical protein